MASPGGSGSDDARKGEHNQPSSSSSSSRSISSFTRGDSCSTSRSSATTMEPTCLTIQLLEEITDNFSEERALGQGSYGKVYKGIHKNGEEVAVKLLYNSIQAIDDEKFQHEFRNLRILDHKNTIRLVGYCYETRRQHMDHEGGIVFVERTYKALCFEYMQMGSLQGHISDENPGLDWQTRYKIIKGTCEGLKYLHEGLKEPIYHLDLKPDNILLDKNMVPKLADFGLSKLFGEEQTRITQNSIGTIGYMPPEYICGNVISKKFDIFSLGVIITKIISGPSGCTRSAEMPCQEFLDQVNENWRNRLETECTSQTLEANCEQVSICTEIGRRCMDEDRHKRPTIVDIIHILDVTETMVEKGATLRGLLSNTTLKTSSCSEALARTFCRQTVNNALNSVHSREDYKHLKAQESPRRFRDLSDALLESIINMYDLETAKYDPKVRNKECQYMLEKLRKVIIEDSRILIQKKLSKTSEQFKREYARNLKSTEGTDVELNYDYQMVDSCVEEFMNSFLEEFTTSCDELKLFDSGYLHRKRGELRKHLHLYTVHHILTIKEIRWRKATELALNNLEEVQTRLKEAIRQREHTQAEMAKQQEEYTLNMLAKQQEHQVALARLFCRQTAEDALNSINFSKDYKLLKAEQSLRRFKEISDKLLEGIITMYDHETELYSPGERDNGRQYMVEKLEKVLKEDSWELIWMVWRSTSEQFKVLSPVGEDADLRDMAAQLLAMLSGPWDGDRGGRKAWDQLQGMLAQVATYLANPRITLDDLLDRLEDVRGASFLRLNHPDAEDLLKQIMLFLGKETNKERDSGMAIPLLRKHLLLFADQLNMVPLRDSEPVHMIDVNMSFCEANVAGIIKCSPQLSARNAPYSVVSIVGVQSSGKSYLLNRLFGTMFPEMDPRRGRTPTTRGIMVSRCIGPSLLVLDVEGYDGIERGQDTLFEKQAALFLLTVSDVMLVNMSVFDICREQAGGILLFKNIFKERSKLEAGLTKILVVLRMYDGEIPLDYLREDMMKILEKMWRSVNPKSLKFEDCIKVNVVALPDKNSKDFPKEVTALRRLLSHIPVDDNRSAKVPASGFSVSSERIWDAIKRNKRIDIPSHQEALAELFCRQTADDALKSVYSRKDYKLLKAEESPQRFKEISDTLLKSALTMYDRETEMYDAKVRDNERQHLLEKINKVR